jgi:hypothetical protein
MKTLRRFGRTVTMPSTVQIRRELRAIVLPEAKPASVANDEAGTLPDEKNVP